MQQHDCTFGCTALHSNTSSCVAHCTAIRHHVWRIAQQYVILCGALHSSTIARSVTLECRRLQGLVDEKSEALVSSLQISSMMSSMQQEIAERQQEVIRPMQGNIEKFQNENERLQDEVARLQAEAAGKEQQVAELEKKLSALRMKLSTSMQANEVMQSNTTQIMQQLAGVQEELNAAYQCSQKHMTRCDALAAHTQALQQQSDAYTADASRVISELTQALAAAKAGFQAELQESMSASQQKLVSLSAHSETKDERIAALEEEMQQKEEEAAQLRDDCAALEKECAQLFEANEAFVSWKREAEAWSAQATLMIEGKDALAAGNVLLRVAALACVVHWFAHSANGIPCRLAEPNRRP